ncbi:MAG: NUDIX hydrolase [Paenisporosarcina sp.]
MEYYKELRKYVGHRPLILPGSVVIIQNEKGEILLQERTPNVFGLPGGLMDLGESLEDTAIREVYEETNLKVENLELVHVFSGPDYFFKLDNGDEFYSVTAVYKTSSYHGELIANLNESVQLLFVDIDKLPEGIIRSHKKFLETCL